MSPTELPRIPRVASSRTVTGPTPDGPPCTPLAVVTEAPIGALTLLLNHDTVVDACDLLGAQTFALCDDRITFVVGSGPGRRYLRALIGDRLLVDETGHWARVPRSNPAC